MAFAKNVIENSHFTIAYRNHNFQYIKTKLFVRIALSYVIYVFEKVIFNWVGVPSFWEGQVEK